MEVIPEVLVRNLRALAEHDRGLAERLLLPADNVDLRFEGRRALYRHHLEWIDLEPPAPAPDAAASAMVSVMVLGAFRASSNSCCEAWILAMS